MDSLAGLIAAIYARFSSDNQKDTSIDDQVSLCRGYLSRQGGVVKDENILTDYAISGTQYRAREGFDRLSRGILHAGKPLDEVAAANLTAPLGPC